MIKYKQNYLDYHNLTIADWIPYKNCHNAAQDFHHLVFKSQSGTDEATNLVPLCRDCHNKAHDSKEFNEKLKLKNLL